MPRLRPSPICRCWSTPSLSIADLRARGVEALAIAALLARLGAADPVEPVTSLDALLLPLIGRAKTSARLSGQRA